VLTNNDLTEHCEGTIPFTESSYSFGKSRIKLRFDIQNILDAITCVLSISFRVLAITRFKVKDQGLILTFLDNMY